MRVLRFTLSLAAALVFGAAWLHAEPAVSSKAAFLRTTDLPDKARGLQTASIEYRPASGTGPAVWLVGVAHLGTAEYFQTLQQRLDRQTVVLYEGIGLRDVKKGPGKVGDAGIQSALARALGLKFQLEAIDYRRPSFVNSDLHVPDLQNEIRERGPAGAPEQNDTFDQLLGALQGDSTLGSALTQAVGLLGVSPQMREMTKMILIEVLGQAGELLAMSKAVSPELRDLLDVILTQRNQIVLRDLRTQIAQRHTGEAIAVFYGAAHMDELATRLATDLGYVPVKTEWDTAFTGSTADSGIAPAQIQFLLEMMRSQLAPAGK